MKAVILCAGYGTRLGELTQQVPKPMLPLQGRPLLEYIIVHLRRSGFTQAIINLHFMAEHIRSYFDDGSRWDMNLTYSHEPELLGTAGGVRKMKSLLCREDSFLVQYGDILTDQDLALMLSFHRQRRALATLLLHRRTHSNSIVTIDDDGCVVDFCERPPLEHSRRLGPTWVNSSVFICDPALLDIIPPDKPCDFPRDVFPKIVNRGLLFGFPLTGYRCAVDSPDRLAEAQIAVAEGKCNIELPRNGVF